MNVFKYMYMCVLSHVQPFVSHELELTRFLCSLNFPGKNTGVGCHGNLPAPGIKSMSLVTFALPGEFFTTTPPRKPKYVYICIYKYLSTLKTSLIKTMK